MERRSRQRPVQLHQSAVPVGLSRRLGDRRRQGAGRRQRRQPGFLQPFGIFQLGDGWYLRSTGVWNYDFETDNYSMPVGLGVGKVIITEPAVLNVFFEPQVAIASEGPGQREWGAFFGINFQLR